MIGPLKGPRHLYLCPAHFPQLPTPLSSIPRFLIITFAELKPTALYFVLRPFLRQSMEIHGCPVLLWARPHLTKSKIVIAVQLVGSVNLLTLEAGEMEVNYFVKTFFSRGVHFKKRV